MDEDPEVIIPRYKMIISYDVALPTQESYYQFIISELVPAMQEMGVYMTEAWHTAFGAYPLRMAAFVAEDFDTIERMLESDRWQELENQFRAYVRNYSMKVIPYRQGFQFVRAQTEH
jgi:hypothetical protein